MDKRILPFLITVLLYTSCVDRQDPITYSNLTEQFEIALSQTGSDEGMKLSLELESVDNFLCHDAEIISSKSISSSEININILRIDVPPNCINQSATVKTSIPVKTNKATYTCRINIGDLSNNTGSLIVTDNYYYLDFDHNDGLVLLNNRIRKLPDNHFWGSISYNASINPSLNDTLLLNQLGSLFPNLNALPSDDYGIFTISDDQHVSLRENRHILAFVAEHKGAQDAISILSNWESQTPSLSVNAYFDDGNTYLK